MIDYFLKRNRRIAISRHKTDSGVSTLRGEQPFPNSRIIPVSRSKQYIHCKVILDKRQSVFIPFNAKAGDHCQKQRFTGARTFPEGIDLIAELLCIGFGNGERCQGEFHFAQIDDPVPAVYYQVYLGAAPGPRSYRGYSQL